MNRVIKAKIWDKTLKRFVDPEHIYIEATGNLRSWSGPLEPSRFIVLQWTGLTASGKELYDGDLFRIRDEDDPKYYDQFIFEVYWDTYEWDVRIYKGPQGGHDMDMTQNWLPDPDEEENHTIVGNIFEGYK
jgi:hypothetical protein